MIHKERWDSVLPLPAWSYRHRTWCARHTCQQFPHQISDTSIAQGSDRARQGSQTGRRDSTAPLRKGARLWKAMLFHFSSGWGGGGRLSLRPPDAVLQTEQTKCPIHEVRGLKWLEQSCEERVKPCMNQTLPGFFVCFFFLSLRSRTGRF